MKQHLKRLAGSGDPGFTSTNRLDSAIDSLAGSWPSEDLGLAVKWSEAHQVQLLRREDVRASGRADATAEGLSNAWHVELTRGIEYGCGSVANGNGLGQTGKTARAHVRGDQQLGAEAATGCGSIWEGGASWLLSRARKNSRRSMCACVCVRALSGLLDGQQAAGPRMVRRTMQANRQNSSVRIPGRPRGTSKQQAGWLANRWLPREPDQEHGRVAVEAIIF
jgi:hypothetical protein